jgi:hypothetical protein
MIAGLWPGGRSGAGWVTSRAWALGGALDWAAARAAAQGFAQVTVACEPTGHRWRVLGQLAVLGLRWFRDRTMPNALARDHGVSRVAAWRYPDEVIMVLAEQARACARHWTGR